MIYWYVARLHPGHNKAAIESLRQSCFEIFYPLMVVPRVRRGRILEVREPVFPNYLFVHCEPDPTRWCVVNTTRGVRRLLGQGIDNVPVPLRNGEIEDLRAREAQGELRYKNPHRIQPGDRVQFKNGNFAGLVQTQRHSLQIAEAPAA